MPHTRTTGDIIKIYVYYHWMVVPDFAGTAVRVCCAHFARYLRQTRIGSFSGKPFIHLEWVQLYLGTHTRLSTKISSNSQVFNN